MSGFEIRRPTDRRDIQVALICGECVFHTSCILTFFSGDMRMIRDVLILQRPRIKNDLDF